MNVVSERKKMKAIRDEFPILKRFVQDEPLVYLDNAATTQKPFAVLEAIEAYYKTSNANVHRGVHTLAEEATQLYEAARENMRRFIHARSEKEVLFTRGATTGLNWVAKGYVLSRLQPGDEVLISPAEHHSNLVVWQQVCQQTGAFLVYMSLHADGQLDMESIAKQITTRTKVVAIAHASNVLGTINDIQTLAKWVHEVNGVIVVDGAQAAAHTLIDVQKLDCDFYAFSGHKMMGPTGIGVLYGKEELLEQMTPLEFGGEMIEFVFDQHSTWAPLPFKFEAGTPNIAGAIGLSAAAQFIERIGFERIAQHEKQLVSYVLPKLLEMPGITVYGPSSVQEHSSVIAFNIDGVHPHDVATAMDVEGIAIRAGHHCAQPLMRWLQVPATARASFSIYNTMEEAKFFIETVEKVKEFFLHGSN